MNLQKRFIKTREWLSFRLFEIGFTIDHLLFDNPADVSWVTKPLHWMDNWMRPTIEELNWANDDG